MENSIKKCPLCNKEVSIEKEFYCEGSYHQQCATIGCEKCGLWLYSKTIRTAKSRWKKLIKG